MFFIIIFLLSSFFLLFPHSAFQLGVELQGRLVNLPTITESLKTVDNKFFYKIADISQMVRLSYKHITCPVLMGKENAHHLSCLALTSLSMDNACILFYPLHSSQVEFSEPAKELRPNRDDGGPASNLGECTLCIHLFILCRVLLLPSCGLQFHIRTLAIPLR